ncbi:hypothetical protein [Rouxiella sp. Mn2063]|uniref:hypothetical protein n=1 Tax=Rouxiella sp. Mn2063 TaxID=3395262 RepID=UPI003BC91E88
MAFPLKQAAFLVSFLLGSFPVLPVVAATAATAANTQSAIDAVDFSVVLNKQHFSLGDKWDEQAQKRAGMQRSEAFVGDVPVGDSSYKFYQHSYAGYDIYTANLFWETQHRDVDSYLVAQITLEAPGIATSRGISVGDTPSDVTKRYGRAMTDDSDNQHWLYYESNGKRLSFQIENDKVSRITMVFNIDN